jgi:pseudaminic acid biosynthesis-associated methylase
MEKWTPSEQLEYWTGRFGTEYSKRNPVTLEIVEKRGEFFKKVLDKLKPVGILEVGCNVGLNLASIGMIVKVPNYVVGVEPNEPSRRAAEISGLRVYPDFGQDLKFADESFSLVFTCGVLIHLDESSITKVIREMIRVSRKYLLFIEYYSETDLEVEYHGMKNMLWKRNWPKWLEACGVTKKVDSGVLPRSTGFDNCHWWIYEK